MSEQLFLIGKEYSVSKFGEMYFKGERMENECSHGYGVYLDSFSFEEIEKNSLIIRSIVIGIKDMRNITYRHIMFDGNSKYFNNLTWEEYKEAMKIFLRDHHRWFLKKTETYFR